MTRSEGGGGAPVDGYRYHNPEIEPAPRTYWINRAFRALLTLGILTTAWLAHEQPPLDRVLVTIFNLKDVYPGAYIGIVVASIAMYPFHELVHGVAGRLLGLRVRYGFDWYGPTPFVVTYGRPQTQAETAYIAAAPLVSISLVLFPLIVFGSSLFAAVMLLPLIVNTLGAATDLNTIWEMYQLESGVLIEHDREENAQYYIPDPAD